MQSVLKRSLAGKEYTVDGSPVQVRELADEIRNQLRELNLPRYKFLVQVTIGEVRGQGAHMGTRCFWDEASDGLASTSFQNDSLFCIAQAYGVYTY